MKRFASTSFKISPQLNISLTDKDGGSYYVEKDSINANYNPIF